MNLENDANDGTPDDGGWRPPPTSTPSSCTKSARTPDRCTRCRWSRPSTCHSRKRCLRPLQVTRMIGIRLVCEHRETRRSDPKPNYNTWVRCCTGRRRWPATRALLDYSSKAGNRDEDALLHYLRRLRSLRRM